MAARIKINICNEINEQQSYGPHKGITPLTLAILKGNVDIVKQLLAVKNINVNKMDSTWTPPIITAIDRGNPEIVNELLKIPEIQEKINNPVKGKLPIQWALVRHNTEVAKLLLKQDYIKINTDVLIYAIVFDNQELVDILLERPDIDINAENNRGISPLMQAQH